MGDKKNQGTSQVPDEVSVVDPEEYVSKEEFERARREWQSQKDREIARLTERARREAEEEARRRFLAELESNPDLADVRDQLELQHKLAKAEYYEQQERQRREVAEYRQRLVETFDIEESALEDATTRDELFQAALRARDAKLIAEIKGTLDEEEEESDGPPDVPTARGPAPDATLLSEDEWVRKTEELRQAAKDTEASSRERRVARLEYSKLMAQRPRKSRRPQV